MGFYPPDSLVQEASRTGVEVLPPDVNHSRVECVTEWPGAGEDQPAVRIGLGYVKGANGDEMERLVAERDRGGAFGDLGDLASRLPLQRSDLEQLAWAGALRSLPRGDRVSGLWSVGLSAGRRPVTGGRQLALPFSPEETPELDEPHDWARVQAEYSSIGMTLEGHPMALARRQIPESVLPTTRCGGATSPELGRGSRASGGKTTAGNRPRSDLHSDRGRTRHPQSDPSAPGGQATPACDQDSHPDQGQRPYRDQSGRGEPAGQGSDRDPSPGPPHQGPGTGWIQLRKARQMSAGTSRKIRTESKRLFVQDRSLAEIRQFALGSIADVCGAKCTGSCKHMFVSDRGPKLRTYVRAEREEKQPGSSPGGRRP